MNKYALRFLTICFTSLSVLICFSDAYTQQRVQPQKNSASKTQNDYWAAQRSLESALAGLEKFLNDTSRDDPRWETAADQVQMLREIRLVPSQNAWSMLVKNYLNRPEMEWRVASIEISPDSTRAVLEIRNANLESERCFDPLSDLTLIDNRGRYVPMTRADGVPQNTKVQNIDRRTNWCLAANQVVITTIEFAPLAAGTTSGQIAYRTESGVGAKPVRFSLFQQKIN
jgi:hypothetical protein